MIEVKVSTAVNPTEDKERVEMAVMNMFPLIDIGTVTTDEGDFLEGTGDIESLRNIHDLFRRELIIDTARTRLEAGSYRNPTRTRFLINKQVATIGKLNFPAIEEPLGSIHVDITTDTAEDMEILIEWLTPPTEEGIPLFEPEMPKL
ncbi:RNA-binding domain-containing protein [Methanococcoides sp. AM1]|uniref:RNA-binding domain-containing protein n=1 Tax=Methanococcoides sp. AM1 TaxID=1201011 RepID=UPI001082AF7D|nr:RNA-binding domain-containing protein [Methanococcoides sp. AM1]